MSHRPTARIIRTTAEKFQQSQGLQNWVTPHSVGRCHEVTEGTGDRWEDRENMKVVSKALNEMNASNSTLLELCFGQGVFFDLSISNTPFTQ